MNQLEQKYRINSILKANDLPSAEELIENSFHQSWNADIHQEYPDGPATEALPAGMEQSDWDADEADDAPVPDGLAQELLQALPKLWKSPTASRPRSAIIQDFEECYQAYLRIPLPKTGWDPEGDRLLEKLITHLSDLCTYIIYRKIHTFFFYQPGDEMDLTNIGHMKAIQALRKDRAAGNLRSCPAAYYCRIYKNVTLDLLRRYGICAKKDGQAESGSTGTLYAIRGAVSLERLTTSPDGEDLSDHFDKLGNTSDEEDRAYHSSMCSRILKCYFQTLMNYNHTPPAPLALMYARVLYNVERLFDAKRRDRSLSAHLKKHKLPADRVPEAAAQYFSALDKQGAATSAQWAMIRMGKSTIAQLLDESERVLQRHFDKSLKWGCGIRDKSRQPAGTIQKPWGEVVYTEVYSQRTVAQYALDCHKSMLTKTAGALRKDSELMDYIRTSGCGGSLNPLLRKKKAK